VRGEPLERRGVEEVERDGSVADRRGETVERHARVHDALDERRAAEVGRGEPPVGMGSDDAELDEPGELVDLEAAPFRGLGQLVPIHER